MKDRRSTNFIMKKIYGFLGAIDYVVYFLLTLVFEIFFNIVEADFLSSSPIMANFYNRLQLLVGIFVVFKLSFSLVSGLVNPDKVSDKKSGVSNIIIRVMTSLAMLTLITPLSGIPNSQAPEGSFNYELKQRGILFGTLQSLQDRIIHTNVLGKLILGANSDDSSETENQVKDSANKISTAILKGFVQPNVKNSNSNEWICNGDTITIDGDNIKGDSETAGTYYNATDVSDVVNAVNKACPDNGDYYQFSYLFLISTACGILFVVIVAAFSIDVAIRLIKLTILRFIAPIPIISYIDPKSENDGAFGSWVKTLVSVYLDLFLRIGIIYFAVFIVINMIDGNITFPGNNLFLNALSYIVIWIGLFFFAKQAPKFLKDMLGIKGDGKSFFGSTAAALGLGAGAVKAGLSYRDARVHGQSDRKDAIMDVIKRGNNPISKLLKGSDDTMPNRAEYRKGVQEAKKQEKLYNEGKVAYDQAHGKAENLKFKNKEYQDSFNMVNDLKKNMYAEENKLKDAELKYQAAQQSGVGVAEARDIYEKAKQSAGKATANYEKAKGFHATIQKRYTDDARKENAFDLYSKTGAATMLLNNSNNNTSSTSNTGSTDDTGSIGNNYEVRDRIESLYVNEAPTREEHNQRQADYNDLFFSETGSNYLDANEREADRRAAQQNNNNNNGNA